MSSRRHRLGLLVVLFVGAAFAGACRDEAGVIPDRLPESIAEEALPPTPKLALAGEVDAPPAPGAPVVLALAARDGETWADRVELHRTVRHSGPGVPRAESEIGQELTVEHQVVGGRIRARVSDVELQVKPELPDAAAAFRKDLEGLSYSFARDARGRATDVQLGPDAAPGARAALRAFSAAMDTASVALPEGPVAAGATWTTERDVTVPLTGDAEVPGHVRTEATLRGVATVDGRPHAVIALTLRQDLRGSFPTDGATAEVVGAAKGQGVALLDLERGRIDRLEVAVGSRHELLVQEPAGRRLLVQEETLRLLSREVR